MLIPTKQNTTTITDIKTNTLKLLEDKQDALYAKEIEHLPKGKGVNLADLEKEYQ